MIDIHSHVLPGIDDGAATLEVSLEMLSLAAEHGTTDIVATPHANLEYRFDVVRNAELLGELEARIDSRLKVHLGCDFHLSFENIEDAMRNPRKYTIAGGKYMLVEFSDLIIFKTTSEIFGNLLSAGMVPIITHPERNLLLQQRIQELREWVAMGCGIQVTGQSLLGDFGSKARKFSELLMDEGLVQVIASDGHDPVHRPPVLDRARDHVAARWGSHCAGLLFLDNPFAVLKSAEWRGSSEKRKRRWFGIFS